MAPVLELALHSVVAAPLNAANYAAHQGRWRRSARIATTTAIILLLISIIIAYINYYCFY